MENSNKAWRMAVLLLILVGVVGAIVLERATKVDAQPSSISVQTTAASSTFQSGMATTTLSFMTAGTGTSTYQIDSNGAFNAQKPNVTMQAVDAGSVQILFNASSTASILAYQFQYSNNSIDWYTETSQQTLGSTGNATSSPVTHTYASGATGVSQVTVPLPSLQALHERIVFTTPIGSPNGAVYAEVVTKRNPSSP